MSERVRRFVLFCGDKYYPGGGVGDMVGSFDTMAEAQSNGEAEGGEWQQVLDLETGVAVARSRAYHGAPWRKWSEWP